MAETHVKPQTAENSSETPNVNTQTAADESGTGSPHNLRFEEAVCELCGKPPTDYLLTTQDLGWHKPGDFNLVRCTQCNLIITTPRPIPECMPVYYEDWYNYKSFEEVREEHANSGFNRFVKWMRLKIIEKTGPMEKGMRVLDVGAGFGAQLDYYIEQRGVTGCALDFDPTVSDHSFLKDKAEVRTGDLLTADFEPDSFDIVTLYETLEHVYQPKATLEAAYRILKPGGRLVVEVPDFGAPWRHVFKRYWFAVMVPVHLHHFTRDSLDRVVKAAGFEPQRHVGVYVPFESTASIAVMYSNKFDPKIMDRVRRFGTFEKPYRHAPFFLGLAFWTAAFDLPLQFWMWLANRTGVQTLIATKPNR